MLHPFFRPPFDYSVTVLQGLLAGFHARSKSTIYFKVECPKQDMEQ